jgi:hypothetical protein
MLVFLKENVFSYAATCKYPHNPNYYEKCSVMRAQFRKSHEATRVGTWF